MNTTIVALAMTGSKWRDTNESKKKEMKLSIVFLAMAGFLASVNVWAEPASQPI